MKNKHFTAVFIEKLDLKTLDKNETYFFICKNGIKLNVFPDSLKKYPNVTHILIEQEPGKEAIEFAEWIKQMEYEGKLYNLSNGWRWPEKEMKLEKFLTTSELYKMYLENKKG